MTKEIRFAGKSKPLDEIDFHDFEISPIWIFALDEEEIEGQDETWVQPIASPVNVSSDLYEAYILLHTQKENIRFVVAPDKENAILYQEDKVLFQKKKMVAKVFREISV